MTLVEILHADDGIDGYLEWVSGLVVVNRTLAQWQSYLEAGNPFDHARQQLTRTLVHESYHFHQILCTGWPFRLVTALAGAIGTSLGRDARQRNASIERLLRGESIELAPEALELAAGLDRAGAAGLTVRSIVESAAYLFEFRAEYAEQTARSFVEQMHIEALPADYTAAWHAVAARVGEEAAFELLLPVAVVALCFDDPPAAFAAALSALTDADAQHCVASPLAWMRAVGQRVSGDVAVLGSGAEVAERLDGSGGLRHAIYYPALRDANARAGAISPLVLLTDPGAFVHASEQILQPVCLRDRAVWVPARLREQPGLREAVQSQQALAALSLLAQGQLALPRPRGRIGRPA